MSFHRLVMSAALAGGIACAAPLALAREPVRGAVGAVTVDGVDVEQVAALGAGVPLNFTVFGTPGALVTLRIDGGRRVLELREVEPGVYEGSYLIDGVDAVRPESRVTATLQKNGAVAYAALDEPLLLAKGTVPWAPPRRARGAPRPPRRPQTTMPVPIAVTPRQPRVIPPAAFAATPPPSAPAPCGDCAVVESVRAVEVAPRGGVIGAIGGAIAGAILGKELGEAHKQRMLTASRRDRRRARRPPDRATGDAVDPVRRRPASGRRHGAEAPLRAGAAVRRRRDDPARHAVARHAGAGALRQRSRVVAPPACRRC